MSPRPQAAERLRRVIALVPYIAGHGEVTVTELARAFGVGEDVIRRDLEILPYCGLPPYTADRLIDVQLLDDTVSVRFAEYFARPLRLTAAEGFTLLVAGQALLELDGVEADGPLGRALDKLQSALGAQQVVDVDLGETGPVARLRRAVDDHERVEIDYYSFGRDEMTTRRIDPVVVTSLRGDWYVHAYCHQAGEDRIFRVDRIQDIRNTGEHFEAAQDATAPSDVFTPGAGDTEVVVDLPPSGRWVPESYPTVRCEDRPDGGVRVTLRVAARPWLDRILLTVGPEARVVEPASWQRAGADAAARVLRRYER